MDIVQKAKDLLMEEANAIQFIAETLNDSFQHAAELLAKTTGRIIVTGVGKSGHVGKKIAATMASTGSSAFFVHPTEALHGDLGMFLPGDSCLAISHSGNTKELKEILPSVKKLGIPVVLISKDDKGGSAQYADFCLQTKVAKEACPLNLAPTTSTTVTLAIGDALSVALMEINGFQEKDFALRHPGGALGKKLLNEVKDCMSTTVPQVNLTTSLADTLLEISEKRLGMTVVMDAGVLNGLITDGDVRRAIANKKTLDLTAKEIMTKHPLTIQKNILINDALLLMEEKKVTSLVVVEDEKPIGVLHIHQIFG